METVSSDTFWFQVQGLHTLLSPFAEAVASVQARIATLADITLYLLKLANALEAAKTANVLPAGEPTVLWLPWTVLHLLLHSCTSIASANIA